MDFISTIKSETDQKYYQMLDGTIDAPFTVTPKISQHNSYSVKRNKYYGRLNAEKSEFNNAIQRIKSNRDRRLSNEKSLRDEKVRIGMELGLQAHLKDRLPGMVAAYPFDFVIGSSHLVHGMDPYYTEYFEGKEEDKAYREYFESILENLAAFDCFDVYGHIDYIVRYGPNQNQFYTYEKFADVIDEILRTIIQKGKGIEINTAGFKYGLGHPHPTEQILKRYQELGGEILTIGSDAHKAEHVGFAFGKAPAILQEAGFRYYTVFKQRKAEFYPLEG